MIEDKIAIYISNALSLTLGTDIFLHNLPSDDSEGIAVQLIRDLGDYNSFSQCVITIFFLYRNWSSVKSKLETLKPLFNERRGKISAEWSISSEIRINHYGIDEYDRYITSMNLTVKY